MKGEVLSGDVVCVTVWKTDGRKVIYEVRRDVNPYTGQPYAPPPTLQELGL